MKKIITTVIAIVMLLMTYGNLGVFADDIMLSAYLDVLNSHSENGMMPRYLIYDIDGNGVSELLIMNGTCEGDKQLYIYAYLDENVCCLGEIGAWHAWYQKIPNKNGVLLFNGRATEGTLISIVGNKLYTEEGYEYTEDMIDIGFTDKSDISGFDNFNYVPVNNVSNASFNAGIGRGIEYYNEGLYYQAINEIQWFCDINWYNMTADQQEKALFYLGQSKINLADYSFETGKNYYNKGLYYEAKPYFESAMDYYNQVNYRTQWQSANDYLYNTNERIKEWKKKQCYSGTNIPTYTNFTGRTVSETAVRQGGSQYLYQYPINYNDDSIINESNKYMTVIRSLGWENYSQKRSEYGITFYFRKNASMIGVNIDFKNYTVIISMIIK